MLSNKLTLKNPENYENGFCGVNIKYHRITAAVFRRIITLKCMFMNRKSFDECSHVGILLEHRLSSKIIIVNTALIYIRTCRINV